MQGPDNKDFMQRKRQGGGPGRGGHQGGPRNDQMSGQRNPDERLLEKLSQISGATYELPSLDTTEKKFAGRNRLYIGNIPNELSEDELHDLFKPYGETSELFVNKEKNFGFIRMVIIYFNRICNGYLTQFC